MSPEQFSIIIPTYNRRTHLNKCIDSFARQDYPSDSFEIIVVDDGSHDGTGNDVQKQKESNPLVHLHYFSQTNRGVSAARNRGLEYASGEFVIFMDDDCFVERDFLRKVHTCLGKIDDRSMLLVQVNLKNPEPDNIYGIIWEYLFQSRILHEFRKNNGRYVDLLGGVFVANAGYLKVNSFDENFTTAAEDTDLKRRLRAPKLFSPELVVYHTPRKHLIDVLSQRFNYGRGYERLKRKWTGKQEFNDSFDFSPYLSIKALRNTFGRRAIRIKFILYLYSISTKAGIYSEIFDRHYGPVDEKDPDRMKPVRRSPGHLQMLTFFCTAMTIDLISIPFGVVHKIFRYLRG